MQTSSSERHPGRLSTTNRGHPANEILQFNGGLPVDDDSFFVFTKSGKNDLYVNFELALFKDDPYDSMKFSYPADHLLAGEFEDQMTKLIREYTGDGEYLAVHHPDEPDAKDDAPDSTALAIFASVNSTIDEVLVA